MADFSFGDALGTIGNNITNNLSNRFQQVSDTLQNPFAAIGQANTSTNDMPTAPGPVAPTYNANIAQQESGNTPNIGYHNQNLSSAFGPYGTTAAGWADARKVNPSLPADITQASPDQLTAGQTAYTQQNAKYLQSYGIPVNDNTLSAAHFLGAKGLSDYQQTGYISPAAAAANGGEDNVRQIVNARLGGQFAPASGGAQQPQASGPANPYDMGEFAGVDQAVQQQAAANANQPQPSQAQQDEAMRAEMDRQNAYNTLNSGDVKGTMSLLEHPDKAIANQAAANMEDMLKGKRLQEYAQSTVDKSLANGEIPDTKRLKGEEGSYIKAYLFARLGLNDLAQQEQEKISPSKLHMPIMLGNDHYNATYSKDGELLYARDESGKLVDDATKAKLAANAFGSKDVKTGQTLGYDKAGNVIAHSILPNGQVQFRDLTNNRILTSAPEGYHTGKDQQGMLADSAYKQSLALDEAENRKQKAAGLQPMFSPEQMEARAQGKRNSILGLQHPGGETPLMTPTAAPAGAPTMAPTTTPAPAATTPQATGTPLEPSLEAQAQSIARGETKMPTGLGANNRRAQALQNRVYQINPSYDSTMFDKMKKTEDEFNTGKLGQSVKSMNVAIDHLDTLQQAANALNNGNLPLFNKIGNLYAKNTGESAPGNFDAVKTIVGSEVSKAIAGGATALGDREEIRREIDNAKSPQQLAGVIQKYQQLLSGQVKGLHQEFLSGHGRQSEWDTKLNPRTKMILEGKTLGSSEPGPYADTNKEQRYQEWLKRHPEYQGTR